MRLDYATSSHLMLLDQHEQPDMTIWANATSDETHWIGVYAGDHAPQWARAETFPTDDLQTIARGLQRALSAAQLSSKDPPRYRFATDLPPDGPQQLTRLAVAGWKAYTALFNRPQEASPAAAIREGLLAIALCRPERTNIPWAALYDYHLDGEKHELCTVFRNERVLDGPAACRARVDCPLRDPQRASRTVCPFGFWGIRHRIEQPLSHIAGDEALSDEAPYDELQRAARLGQTIARGDDEPSIVIAAFPEFKKPAQGHFQEVAALSSRSRCESDRDVVLQLLADAGNHFYYFFCHGVGERMDFKLRVEGDIGVADLNHTRFTWRAPAPAPLVFLNGCDTTAFRSDRINKLLERLRAMGASGVIGTEIPVHTSLAAEVGRRLLRALIDGKRIGDAFREMRRELLCEQLNPLGLAYTPFASARLHLCSLGACAACTGTPIATTSSTRRK
ncbi:MAG TPA: CHAT domain-containing protein [Kofleriaceae bacterium]